MPVRHLWIVDPIAKVLEVYRADNEQRWVTLSVQAGGEKVRAEPFDAIELDLAILWAR
jgi:Uma2 family endonuclease